MVPSHRHEDRSSVPKTHIKVGVGMVGTFVISMLKKRDWRIIINNVASKRLNEGNIDLVPSNSTIYCCFLRTIKLQSLLIGSL